MTWYAFIGLNGGKAIDLAGSQEKQATAEGFHGYSTQSQAQANPNVVNTVTRVFADAFIADYSQAVKQGSQPGGPNANILNPVTAVKAGVQGDTADAESLIPGFQDAEHFLSWIGAVVSSKNTWYRVAKVGVGGFMIMVAFAKLTNLSNTAAKSAVKIAPFL